MKGGLIMIRIEYESFEEKLKEAIQFNKEMDEVEKRGDFPSEKELPLFVQLRTAEAALESGLKGGRADSLFEGFAMVKHINRAIVNQEKEHGHN